MRSAAAFLPAALYAAILFLLSSQASPLGYLPSGLLAQDKLLHAAAYAGLAGLLVPGLRRAGLSRPGAVLAAIAIARRYGVSDEFHQSFVPGRDADVLDWIADTVGAAVGAVASSAALALRAARGAG